MLEDAVIDAIAHVRKIPPETITMDSTFDDLGIDSLSGIAIAYQLEEKFNVSIPNDAAMEIRSVREMVDGLRKLLEESGGSAASGASPP